jgi:hypothetical protein
MAIFTTLVTATKLLVKKMIKKKLKQQAKKFIAGDKNKKKKLSKQGTKVEKRQTLLQSQQEKVAKMKESPSYKPLNASKLMNTDADKVTKTATKTGKIDYKVLTAKVDNIVGMTDALAFLTGAQSEQKKEQLKLLRQQKEIAKRKQKEKKLEKKTGGLGDKIKQGVKKTAQGPLDAMIKFFVSMALGTIVMFLLKNVDKIKEMFKLIGDNLNKFAKLLRVTIFAFQEGMKLVKAGFKMAANGLKKVLSPIGKALKAIGSKIKNVFKSLGGKFLKLLKRIPGVKGLTNLIKGVGKTLTATKTVAKNVVKKTVNKVKKPVTKTVSKVKKPITKITSKVTSKVAEETSEKIAKKTSEKIAKKSSEKIAKKVTSNVFKKGITKSPTRILIKFFGKDTAKAIVQSPVVKMASKAAKGIRIPIIGPLIVAVTSILSGDKFEKTMFKTLGTAFGGMIGGGLGAALGGLGAPFGMLVGEIVGEFIGDLLYNMLRGDDDGTKSAAYLKKKFTQVLTGAGNVAKSVMNFAMSMLGKFGNFFKDGFDKFIDDFPTVKVPEIKVFGLPLGLQTSLGKVAETLGLEKYVKDGRVEEIPDLSLLSPFGMGKLLPHLKNSFFPSGEKEEIPKNGGTSSSGGGEEKEETTAAKVETSDNNERDALDDMLDQMREEDEDIQPTAAHLGDKDTSSTSSTVSDVSSKATYEEIPPGTVILTKPERSDFKGRSGAEQFKKAMIMYNNQKEVLNSYQEAHAATELAKI